MLRVVRLWEVPNFLHPGQINSIEMVFADEKVCIAIYLVLFNILF
jgi:hypothetical protein